MAQAGADLYSKPSTDKNILQAQQDLTTFMFGATTSDATKKSTVTGRFASILAFNAHGATAERTLTAATDAAVYPTLTSDKLIFFCDYSRFTDNVACDGTANPGNTCDTLMQYVYSLTQFFDFWA